MIHQDTIRLLRECDAGTQMGIDAINQVIDSVKSENLKNHLLKCQVKYQDLDSQIKNLLKEYHDEGKEPTPMAKSMSWMKTNINLMMDKSDSSIADLMTDGSNMGVKSINKYLNEYKAADEHSKDIAKKLGKIAEELSSRLRDFL